MTRSLIEWTEETWNPVVGCRKVSEGCDNCYAERVSKRTRPGVPFEKVELKAHKLSEPLRRRKPTMYFVNSMSDLFHDDVPDDFIAQVFAVMAEAPHHTFQVLTKRQGRMASLLRDDAFGRAVALACCDLDDVPGVRLLEDNAWSWPLENVWLGVSVENQHWADIRIPKLLETPAAVRFLSCEPLLGPISLREHLYGVCLSCDAHVLAGDVTPHWPGGHLRAGLADSLCGPVDWRGPNWVIVGGESGPGARPMHPDWARSIRDQCVAAGVPFFFKQWGEWAPEMEGGAARPYGASVIDTTEPDSRRAWMLARAGGCYAMQRVGKKRAGRELDGRTWGEMPERAR